MNYITLFTCSKVKFIDFLVERWNHQSLNVCQAVTATLISRKVNAACITFRVTFSAHNVQLTLAQASSW